jgi:hypothetical protein
LFGSAEIRDVRRPDDERMNVRQNFPTVKHGGSNIKVWGYFSRDGVRLLHRVEGNMDWFMYKDIVQHSRLPFSKPNMPHGWIYQQVQ